MIKDSGERTVYDNGFQRDMHEGKGRMDLLPWTAIMEISKHCENGARKYGEHNIDKGCPQHSLIDSGFRHLAKYIEGWNDEPHLLAAAWNVLWALQQELLRPDMQDLPKRKKETEGISEKTFAKLKRMSREDWNAVANDIYKVYCSYSGGTNDTERTEKD